MGLTIRADLAEAHERARTSLVSAGTWWSSGERRALATAAITAMWSSGGTEPVVGGGAPRVALEAAARLGAGTPHIGRAWYESVADEIGVLEYVELVGLVAVAAAVSSLRRTLGLPGPDLPAIDTPGLAEGDATRVPPPELADAAWNWVPVAAPADTRAAVVQALSAVPSAFDELWHLADAQYIPDAEMVDPRWTRGTLSRVEIELIATRVSHSRECHY